MGSIFLTSGYSRGEHTCLDTGLFSIIDTLNAIRSDRPCRKNGSFEKAYDEIEKWAECNLFR